MRQSVSALKDKIASLYKSISPEQTVPAQIVYRTEQKLKKKNELRKSLSYWKKTEKRLKTE